MSQGPHRAPTSPLVSVDELVRRLADPSVRVLDARWYLTGKSGPAEYAAGHIPGAAYVSLDRDLSAPKGAGPGRHPLPSADRFAAVLARLGVTPTTHVIAYDDAGGSIAARIWWLLRHHGLRTASVLDGGLQAWVKAGLPLSADAPAIVPAPRMHLTARPSGVADKRDVDRLRWDPATLVLDARSADRFEGKSEPVDARAGHIPGARSAPFTGNLTAPGGSFLDRAALADRHAAALRAPTVICYCGSGVTACHNLLALALLGRDDALLYEGSWSDWSADPSLPAATGPGWSYSIDSGSAQQRNPVE